MYPYLLVVHNITRWVVLGALVLAIYKSAEGLITKRSYSMVDKVVRGIASGTSHLQLLIGLLLYVSVSPITKSFLEHGSQGNDQLLFFGVWHAAVMTVAVVLITIGAALAKRAETDQKRFKTSLLWFSFAMLLIISAIPWFRPLLRVL